jgi:hypothetical protein
MTSKALNNIGAICILSYKNDFKTDSQYKIIYTKFCCSQVKKHYIAKRTPIEVHLYKYGSRVDSQKIKKSVESYAISNLKNWYKIDLLSLMDHIMVYFEPEMSKIL